MCVCVCVCVCVHSLLRLTLCDPLDCSPPGASVHRISQAWILEWVVISFSRGSSRPRDQTLVSYIAGRFFTDWATREAPWLRLLWLILCFSLEIIMALKIKKKKKKKGVFPFAEFSIHSSLVFASRLPYVWQKIFSPQWTNIRYPINSFSSGVLFWSHLQVLLLLTLRSTP